MMGPPVHATSRCPHALAFAGMTLVELMIALAVGSILIVGATTVFVQSRETFRFVDSFARLEENARFVLDALEPDVRMAQHFGLTTRAERIVGRAGPGDPIAFAVTRDCGRNWAVHLDAAIEATNDSYAWSCTPNGGAMPGADTLVVRRAAEEHEPPADGRLQIESARLHDGVLFLGAAPPEGYANEMTETHRLIVNGYYVSRTSALSTPAHQVPSLRVKTLVDGPRIEDREVLPGVEDLQVQFGIDTDPIGSRGRGSIDRYVNPDDPLLNRSAYPDVRVLAVRIWLRLRAERPETGFTAMSSYEYADRSVPPPNDGYRRIVVTKTIYLRNARPAV